MENWSSALGGFSLLGDPYTPRLANTSGGFHENMAAEGGELPQEVRVTVIYKLFEPKHVMKCHTLTHLTLLYILASFAAPPQAH